MLIIRYQNGALTLPLEVREKDHDVAFQLLAIAQQQGIRNSWSILRPLIGLIPTVPGMDWDFKQLDPTLESLTPEQREERWELLKGLFEGEACQFCYLHSSDGIQQRKERKPIAALNDEGEPILTPEALPFPSGGRSRADQMAIMTRAFGWAPSEVFRLYAEYSRNEINSLLYTTDELANPDRRVREELDRLLRLDSNAEMLAQLEEASLNFALGLGPPVPEYDKKDD